MDRIQLSDHFSYKRIIRFTLPSVVMIIFVSLYGIVDGVFISNFVGETAFAAVNFVLPYLLVFSYFGFMLGTGGSAVISRMMGQGEREKANGLLSALIYVGLGLGVLFIIVGELALEPMMRLFGAEGELLDITVEYGRIYLVTMPLFIVQYSSESLMVAAEQPKAGLAFTVSAGLTNIILDALFVAVLGMGVKGAAAATCIGQAVGGAGPVVYFRISKNSLLRLGRPEWNFREIRASLGIGTADFLSNASLSVVNIAYNFQLLRMAGEYGVSAYGIIMYVAFIFAGVFMGYSMGIAPVFSYNFGAGNTDEMKNLFRKSMVLIAAASVVLTGLAELTAGPMAAVFAGYDAEFLAISTRALRLFMINFIVAGFNIFGVAFFAALNNGMLSSLLSFSRVMFFQIIFVFLLPLWMELDGVWLSIVFAELCALFVTLFFTVRNRKKYGYY